MPNPSSPRDRDAVAVSALPVVTVRPGRHAGTNGWLSSWGTLAHGEIAGCAPPAVV